MVLKVKCFPRENKSSVIKHFFCMRCMSNISCRVPKAHVVLIKTEKQI